LRRVAVLPVQVLEKVLVQVVGLVTRIRLVIGNSMTEWSFKLLFVSLPILMMYRLLDRPKKVRGVTCKGTDRREGTALASASQWTWKATGLNQPAKSTERKEFDEALPYLLGR